MPSIDTDEGRIDYTDPVSGPGGSPRHSRGPAGPRDCSRTAARNYQQPRGRLVHELVEKLDLETWDAIVRLLAAMGRMDGTLSSPELTLLNDHAKRDRRPTIRSSELPVLFVAGSVSEFWPSTHAAAAAALAPHAFIRRCLSGSRPTRHCRRSRLAPDRDRSRCR